ncbi:hypothetical protein COCSADRAFT_156482 [Bipolaris sorokiniana ND90Pr]|uniref:Uncharacterized protein n=1 Tax=Cochliobolus sativus (strain ND90Pr / ATCC 201652) TaxID=665912 RepID=M2TFI9_COCSN|nr:uncharacterized protein COCSADRAFT_156482 [Bipolaris sorokiniana ND90Pr]EMD68016.1 hypothetical protein COCSADRAFT_156482 [Bipolaris sorokiniana ND90Pr]
MKQDLVVAETSAHALYDTSDGGNTDTFMWLADTALVELRKRWPGSTKDITIACLEVIRERLATIEDDLSIAPDEIEPFLVLSSHLLPSFTNPEDPNEPLAKDEAKHFVAESLRLLRVARRNVVDGLGRTSIQQGSFPALLQATIDALKIFCDGNIAHGKALRN